jgi:hypothetical protein
MYECRFTVKRCEVYLTLRYTITYVISLYHFIVSIELDLNSIEIHEHIHSLRQFLYKRVNPVQNIIWKFYVWNYLSQCFVLYYPFIWH